MLQERYGIHVDYDQRNGMYLMIILDSLQSKQLISHQLQMLLNNQIPHMLKVGLDQKNDSYLLQYDLTAKKRLFQVLQTSPPSISLFYEMAFRLVQTVTNSSMYLLSENQYILHSDFIYCGRDAADLYVCYLPIPATYFVSIEQQIRLLLLRMLSTVDGHQLDCEGITSLMSLLHEEDYNLHELKDTLQKALMRQASFMNITSSHNQNNILKQTDPKTNKQHVWFTIKSIWNKRNNKTSLPTKSNTEALVNRIEEKPITGVTTTLVNKELSLKEELKVIINKLGVEQTFEFIEERFIIGRNQAGVHYIDTTEGISRVHCELIKHKDRVEVKDLGSLNGSYLNGQFLVPYKAYPIQFGDILRIVNTEIRIAT